MDSDRVTPADPGPVDDGRPRSLAPPGRPPWAATLEDVSQSIRHSISSWTDGLLRPFDDGSSTRHGRDGQGGGGEIALGDVEAGDAGAEAPDKDGHLLPPHFEPIPRPLKLMSLPTEVQLLVIRQMPFGDIERLRRTCRHYHRLASPRIMRATFGEVNLRQMLLSHCHQCLFYDTTREGLLEADVGIGWPFSAKCVPCALRAGDRRLDRCTIEQKATLGNFAKVWVCRWCGWPVVRQAAQGHPQFHLVCYRAYTNVMFWNFIAGWIQFAIGIVAAALAWRYYMGRVLVFAPTVTNFILLWFCIAFLVLRGNRSRTFGYTLVLELTILGLWIPPMYVMVQTWRAQEPGPVLPSTCASAVFVALNMVFRLLNVIGNVFLWAEYDRTRHLHPHVPWWRRRLMNPFVSWLIFWTYPQSVEQRYREPPAVIRFLADRIHHKVRLGSQ